MTDVVDKSVADVPTPAPEVPTPSSGSEAPIDPEPRITNSVEGKKKQKEAVKRLSDYSREVMSKKVEPVVDNDPPPQEDVPAASEYPEIPQSESIMSTTNILAAAGVVVAIVCLYFSTRPDKSGCKEPEASDAQEVQKAPKVVVRAPPPKNKPEPKFRRL